MSLFVCSCETRKHRTAGDLLKSITSNLCNKLLRGDSHQPNSAHPRTPQKKKKSKSIHKELTKRKTISFF